MTPFIYTALPTRVGFGRGRLDDVAAEVGRLGMKRPLVITTSHQAASGLAIIKQAGGVAFVAAKRRGPSARAGASTSAMRRLRFWWHRFGPMVARRDPQAACRGGATEPLALASGRVLCEDPRRAALPLAGRRSRGRGSRAFRDAAPGQVGPR